MQNTKYLISIYLLFLFTACSEFFSSVVEIDLPEPEPKMVLWSKILEGDKEVYVILTRTRGVLFDRSFLNTRTIDTIWIDKATNRFFIHQKINSAMDSVPNATISFLKNNTILAQFIYVGNGVYRATLTENIRYTPNDKYTIKASAPGFPTLESTQTVPSPVTIEKISVRKEISIADASDPTFIEKYDEIGMEIIDNASENNYYSFSIYGRQFRNPNYVLMSTYTLDPLAEYNIIPDNTFNGQSKNLTVHLRSTTFSQADTARLLVDVHNHSKEYYLYNASLSRYFDAEDNPFAEPVVLYTNVENGYGLFYLSAVTRKEFTYIR